jgi:SAM-dependent methyltransferase
MTDFSYDAWPSGEPYDWQGAGRGHTVWDAMDYHLDLGAGRAKKARIGIDRYAAPGINIVMNLDTLAVHSLAAAPGEDAPEPTMVVPTSPLGTPAVPPWPIPFTLSWGLPFADNSIESVLSHHALEHVSNLIPLVDEVYRVLKPGGIFYAITPLFPSASAVSDADHRRYFMETTWDAFCGTPGDTPQNCWLASFSVPYTRARFSKLHQDMTAPTPPHLQWTKDDARELRVAMRAER